MALNSEVLPLLGLPINATLIVRLRVEIASSKSASSGAESVSPATESCCCTSSAVITTIIAASLRRSETS